jgi:hypothetical protein
MTLHPGIVALIMGSCFVAAMVLYSAAIGAAVLRRWDLTSSSEVQLQLERKTYLTSTIMNYVLGFEILSSLLFVYTVDSLHRIFVGAMCATGSLNANPVGWAALYAKMAVLFLSAIWIAVNAIDQRGADYPLTRFKFAYLLFLVPVVLLSAVLQLLYFLGLKPNIITSCCGALFSESGGGLSSSLSSVAIRPTMFAFYGLLALFLAAGIFVLRRRTRAARYLFAGLSLLVLPVSLTAVVSFISLYFYESPTHHCPFDIFQGNYHYLGYPLYGSLFAGTFFGIMTGFSEMLRGPGSVEETINRLQGKWIVLSVAAVGIFAAVATWPIVFSGFTLDGYF